MAQSIKMVPNRGRKIRYTGPGISCFRKRLVPKEPPLSVEPIVQEITAPVQTPPVAVQPATPLNIAVDLPPASSQPGSRRGSGVARSPWFPRKVITVDRSAGASSVQSSSPRNLSGPDLLMESFASLSSVSGPPPTPISLPHEQMTPLNKGQPLVVMNWLATNLTRRSGTVPAVCLTDPIGPGRIWSWELPLDSEVDPIQAQGICTETVPNGTLHINFYTTAARGLVGTVQFRLGLVIIRPTEILNSQTNQAFADSTIVEVQTPVERNTGYHYHCEVKLPLLLPSQSFLHLTVDRQTPTPQTFTAPVYVLGLSLTR